MKLSCLLLLLFSLLISSCTSRQQIKQANLPEECLTKSDCLATINDPFESVNRSIFSFNMKLDRYLLKPVSQGYDTITPNLVKRGIDNFFTNWSRPITLINSAAQAKSNAFSLTLTSFLIDTTLGLLGVISWSDYLGIKQYKENFSQSLAYYGVEQGPYLVLPILGPSSVRGATGRFIDFQYSYDPPVEVDSWVLLSMNAIHRRAKLLKLEKTINRAALDQYTFFRTSYLQRTRSAVFDGNPPNIDTRARIETDGFSTSNKQNRLDNTYSGRQADDVQESIDQQLEEELDALLE